MAPKNAPPSKLTTTESIYAVKDRDAVSKEEGRATGATKSYNAGLRYRDIWGSADLANDTEEQRRARNQHADKLNEAYYDFITDHYEGGWGDKFHFCGYFPGESWETAQSRHEHHLALMTDIKAGMRVLDVGCGVGGPAREMAKFTGCFVTGVTINDLHVERSNEYNRDQGLQEQVHMVKGNFVDLPFGDGEFDRAYATEALCCAPDMDRAYAEVFRVLKPGGVLGMLDWVVTDQYDDGNELHRRIRNEIERGGSVPHLTSVQAHVDALERAGFEMVVEEDRATAKANPIPWW
jgi:sterol 24-C-methyltransferase